MSHTDVWRASTTWRPWWVVSHMWMSHVTRMNESCVTQVYDELAPRADLHLSRSIDQTLLQVCCRVLQCVEVCCSVLQYAAVCCSVLQFGPYLSRSIDQTLLQVCCSVLQCAAVCCSVLQCAAVCCSMTYIWAKASTRHLCRWITACWSVLQCVAVCCSVLQCVAVCCSMTYARVEVSTSHYCRWITACWRVLKCIAVSCSVLQCVAVWRARSRRIDATLLQANSSHVIWHNIYIYNNTWRVSWSISMCDIILLLIMHINVLNHDSYTYHQGYTSPGPYKLYTYI